MVGATGSSQSLQTVAIPPGARVTLMFAVTSVSGTNPTLVINLRSFTKATSIITLLSSATITAVSGGLLELENSPDFLFVNLAIGGTSPSFTLNLDFIVTPAPNFPS